MIKTIILDESKVNAFLNGLNDMNGILILNPNPQAIKQLMIDRFNEFLELTKIEPQTTKTNKQ